MEVMTVDLIRDKTDVDVIGSGSFVGIPENGGVHLEDIGLGSVPIMHYRHEMIHFLKCRWIGSSRYSLYVDALPL
jgi:hypothetical protein